MPHYVYTGQITPEESLFCYKIGENVSTFSHPDHVPVFLDEIGNFTEGQIATCGSNTACLYDFLQTGDSEIAAQTKETDEENTALSVNLGTEYLNTICRMIFFYICLCVV